MNTMINKKLNAEELAMVSGGREEKPKGPLPAKSVEKLSPQS